MINLFIVSCSKYEHKGVKREKKAYHYCEYCGHKAERKMLDIHVAMEHTEPGQLEECPHCHVSYHPKYLPVSYEHLCTGS